MGRRSSSGVRACSRSLQRLASLRQPVSPLWPTLLRRAKPAKPQRERVHRQAMTIISRERRLRGSPPAFQGRRYSGRSWKANLHKQMTWGTSRKSVPARTRFCSECEVRFPAWSTATRCSRGESMQPPASARSLSHKLLNREGRGDPAELVSIVNQVGFPSQQKTKSRSRRKRKFRPPITETETARPFPGDCFGRHHVPTVAMPLGRPMS